MYFIDFFKNITKKNNLGVMIWLLLNTVIVAAILGECVAEELGNVPISYTIGALIYLIILIITLSPIGETILRWQNGCNKITRKEDIERLEPLFNEVYAKAKKQNPELPDDVMFYMIEDDDANAFATGRRTVCITRGLLRYSDNHIKAVLGHEFGHLAHKDTDAVLLVAVGNLIVTGLFIFYRIVCRIVFGGFKLVMSFISEDAGMAIAGALMHFFVDVLLAVMMQLWTKLGVLLCMHSSRKNENLADEYSFNLGYGVYLCEFLDSLGPSNIKGLWATLNSSHPDHDVRIAHLQEVGCTYRA